MQPPKTCVITVNYRGTSDTAACVQSLLFSHSQVEIVVVDTTPNDPELGIALEFAPNVTLIRASENIGFGRGNNLGIHWTLANTSCEFIFLLNNDAVVYPESIDRLETAMTMHEDVGIMTPRIAYLDDPEKLWYGGGEIDWRRASAFTPGINRSATAELAMVERDVSFASGCALFLRRSVICHLRGFDPRFFMYEEDVELCLRARGEGIRIRYLPTALILHRAHGSIKSSEQDLTDFWSPNNPRLPFLCFHIIRNRLLNVEMHARGRDLALAVLFFPLFLVRRAGPFLRDGRPDAVIAMLKGIVDFWRARKEAVVEPVPIKIERTSGAI